MRWFILLLALVFGHSAFSEEETSLPALADLPVGITSFGATFHEGAIYVHGGQLGPAHNYSRDQVNQPLLRLEFSEEAEWEDLQPDEPALGPALLSHESGVIRIGGMQPRNERDEEQNMFSVDFVRLFDPESGEWTSLPSLPKGRSSHDAWIEGDKIYVVGGWEMRGVGESSLWSKTVEVMDLSEEEPSWRSIQAPFYRRALAAAVHDGELYCLGGLDKAGDTSDEVDILNLETEEWRKGPALPESPMHGFGMAAYIERSTGDLYVTGFDGVIYVLRDEQWHEIGSFEEGRMFGRFVDPPEAPLVILGGASMEGRSQTLEFVPSEGKD